MRPLALAVLLAAPAASAPADSPKANQDELKVPDRYGLPGKGGPNSISPEVAKLGGEALLKILRDPKDTRHIEAVLALIAKTDQTGRGKRKPYSWKPLADSAAAIDYLLEEGTPLAFRRWAVYDLFASASAEICARITIYPEDRQVDNRWASFNALRARGRRDVDPHLAEFFERYEDDPEAARWPEAKKAAGAARDRMLAARPDAKDMLAETWRLQENIEKNQLIVLARFQSHIDAQTKVPAARRAKLKAVEKSATDHRLRIGWANMVPRIMAEGIGAAEAKSYGFEPVPVRVGWPKIPAR
jgi:hypothetical protein